MKALQVTENKSFIGRDTERTKLKDICLDPDPSITVVYGRRRVGKTELLEQALADRNLLKFEGIEGLNTSAQIKQVLRQLSQYAKNPMIADLNYETWTPVFELMANLLQTGIWTLYFEEVQWLANYEARFISELKYVWDNFFRRNTKLKLVLCGSSPSFMVKKVLHSKALYNRSIYELPLKMFSLQEARLFFPKNSQQEIMDAYLTIGGVPEYLKRIKNASSLFLGICNNAFTKGGYFVNEHERIFISSLSENKHYKQIINILSHKHFATREEIAKQLDIKSGGQLTELLNDLKLCDFIEQYTPYQAKSDTNLIRYAIRDNYLSFYFKFIAPIHNDIINGDYNDRPMDAIPLSQYRIWLGYTFERYCRSNHRHIAKIIGFSAVRYKHGAYFNRVTDKKSPGYQIDLIFDRADNVITICEIKYKQAAIDASVIQELENKIALMNIPKSKSIERVLISAQGGTDELIARAYFDRILTLADLFNPDIS